MPPPPLLLLLLLLAASLAAGDTVCRSPRCQLLTLEARHRQNASADPCEDFYDFACGGYSARARYDANYVYSFTKSIGLLRLAPRQNAIAAQMLANQRDVFDLLATRSAEGDDGDQLFGATQKFFDDCAAWRLRDEAGKEGAESRYVFDDLLRRLLPPESADSLTERLLARAAGSGVSSLLSLRPRSILWWHWLKHKTNASRERLAKAELLTPKLTGRFAMLSVVHLIADLGNVPTAARRLTLNAESFGRFMTKVFDIMKRGESCNRSVECLGQTRIFNRTTLTVAELQLLGDCLQPDNAFNWTLFVSELLGEEAQAVGSLRLLAKRPATAVTLANYLKAAEVPGAKLPPVLSVFVSDWLTNFAEFMPPLVRRLARLLKYRQRDTLLPRRSNAASGCLELTLRLLRPSVERRLLRRYEPDTFRVLDDVVSLVKQGTLESVQRQSWISDAAKEAIAEKLEAMKRSQVHEELPEEKLLATFAGFLRATAQDNNLSGAGLPTRRFARVLVAALADAAAFDLQFVTGRRRPNVFQDFDATTPNAFYIHVDNRLVVPLGFLTPPHFHPSLPLLVNLARLGSVVGHEISHAISHVISHTEGRGSPGPPFDNGTQAEYATRVRCVRTQRELVNGPAATASMTLDEDVSDIIAMSATLGAWRLARRQRRQLGELPLPMSQLRQLFLMSAQVFCEKTERYSRLAKLEHPPFRTRLMSSMLNSPEFAEAFHCRKGARMNPEEKCSFL